MIWFSVIAENLSRKASTFMQSNIEKARMAPCNCARRCYEMLTPNMIVRWRTKYPTLPMGRHQQTKLVEMIKDTTFADGKNRILHLVDGQLLCRY